MEDVLKVRLPEDLKSAIQARAAAEGRTLSGMVRRLLEQALKEEK